MSPELASVVTKAVISLSVALITTFIIPAVQKWSKSNSYSKLLVLIKNMVDAAEQIYGPKTASLKKDYVMDGVRKLAKKAGVSDKELDDLIEAAVYPLSRAVKNAAIESAKLEANKNKSGSTLQVAENESNIIPNRDETGDLKTM